MKDDFVRNTEKLLKEMNVTYSITYMGIAKNPNWNENEKRPFYEVILQSPKYKMELTFWSSIIEAKYRLMDIDQFAEKNIIHITQMLILLKKDI